MDNKISLQAGYAMQALAKFRALSAVCGEHLAETEKRIFVDKLVASGRFDRNYIENHIDTLTEHARKTGSDTCFVEYAITAGRAFDRESRQLFDLLD